MAAIVAIGSNTSSEGFYERQIRSGKKEMVALITLMRKIIVISNARLKEVFLIGASIA